MSGIVVVVIPVLSILLIVINLNHEGWKIRPMIRQMDRLTRPAERLVDETDGFDYVVEIFLCPKHFISKWNASRD